MNTIDFDALDEVEVAHARLFKGERDYLGARYVPGEGGPDAPTVMVIGEAPGATEAAQGRPFVGDAGRILRQLMDLAGLYAHHSDLKPLYGSAYDVHAWITNAVKYRPPRNRTPTYEEINLARWPLLMEWEAIGRPKVIVCVGKTALTAVLGTPQSILSAAGRAHRIKNRQGETMWVWPMVHPSFVLHQGTDELKQRMGELSEEEWERLGEWLRKNNV